jgi:hypothetical protein
LFFRQKQAVDGLPPQCLPVSEGDNMVLYMTRNKSTKSLRILMIAITLSLMLGAYAAPQGCTPELVAASQVKGFTQTEHLEICKSGYKALKANITQDVYVKLAKVVFLMDGKGVAPRLDLAFQLMTIVKLRGQALDPESSLRTL